MGGQSQAINQKRTQTQTPPPPYCTCDGGDDGVRGDAPGEGDGLGRGGVHGGLGAGFGGARAVQGGDAEDLVGHQVAWGSGGGGVGCWFVKGVFVWGGGVEGLFVDFFVEEKKTWFGTDSVVNQPTNRPNPDIIQKKDKSRRHPSTHLPTHLPGLAAVKSRDSETA